MRLLLIVNPYASSMSARNRAAVEAALGAGHTLRVSETSRRGHAVDLAKAAVADGHEVVVVFGGDGTLNEAANGLVAAGGGAALAPIPGGSTNVFARTLGYGNKAAKAADRLLGALGAPGHSVRRVGLGRVDDRYYLFNCGLGFDATVVELVEQHGSLKRKLGHPLFVYATVATFARRFDRKHPHFDLDLHGGPGGDRSVKDVYFALCLKSNPYTYLGAIPLNVSPEAGLTRGISVTAFQKLGLFTLLGVNVAAMTGRGGTRLARRSHLAYATDVASITVRGHHPFKYQMDGEFLGQADNLELSFQPDLLDLVVPAPATA